MSLEELAHIIGQSERGPRGSSSLEARRRDEYENIILLCPTCHTLIDKTPDQFPTELLQEWKRKHEEDIQRVFIAPIYSSRDELANKVHRLLRRNRAIYLEYGPYSEHSSEPLSDAVDLWHRHILSDIIPNNREVANLLTANEHLLNEREKEVLDKFILHQQAFEYNHVSGGKTSAAPLFPEKMNTILLEKSDA